MTLFETCASANWDLQQIAAALHVSRATVYRRLKAAGLNRKQWRAAGWEAEAAGKRLTQS
jgi:AraC-like DNA-binding protein